MTFHVADWDISFIASVDNDTGEHVHWQYTALVGRKTGFLKGNFVLSIEIAKCTYPWPITSTSKKLSNRCAKTHVQGC